jgi:PAS domain S-box-containing protein
MQAHHRDFLDLCETGIIVHGSSGVVHCNRAGCELLQLLTEPSADHPVMLNDILPKDALNQLTDLLQSALMDSAPCNQEMCIVRETGYRHYRVSARKVPETKEIVSFWVDISQEVFARQVLHDKEMGFSELQKQVPVGMLRFMPDGHLVTVNLAFIEMLGYSDENTFYSIPIEKVWFDLNRRIELLQRISDQKSAVNFETQLLKSNGEPQWVSINASGEYDDNGHLRWFNAAVLDISVQKEIESEVESYRNHMSEIVEARTAELSLVNKELIQEIGERQRAVAIQSVIYQIAQAVNVQQSLEELLKTVRKELGKLVDTENFYVALYNNETGKYSFPFVVDAMEASEEWSIPLDLSGSLTDLVRKTGKAILVDEEANERLCRSGQIRQIGPNSKVWLGVPLRISTGVTGVMAVQNYEFSDTFCQRDLDLLSMVSENVATAIESFQARKVLQERETLYRTVTEALAEGLVVTGPDFRVAHSNPAATTILGDRTGEKLQDLVRAKNTGFLNNIRAELEKEQCSRFEATMVMHDGTLREMGVSLSPLCEETGTLSGAVILIRDLTSSKIAEADRLKLEQQVQHTQKLESLGVLAGGIAHDFNNLLSGILGNAELAVRKLPEATDALTLMEEIIKGAKRAAGLSRQMLAYAGKGSFVKAPLKLNPLIREMGELLRVSVSHKISLKFELADDLPEVLADPAQIGQVIMNLITNASEAIGDDNSGTVTVRTRVKNCNGSFLAGTFLQNNLSEGEYLLIEVEDTGSGMNSETLSRIFDPFFTTKFDGRGLGLAAVLGIVKGHAGGLNIQTEPGSGTLFTVLLPKLLKNTKPHCHKADIARKTIQGRTVLVVDDETSVRNVIGKMLEASGNTALLAADGDSGLDILKSRLDDIDCILLDLTMPGKDGIETLTGIREITASVPVIFSSGYPEETIRSKLNGLQIAGFVQKPLSMSALFEAITLAIGID